MYFEAQVIFIEEIQTKNGVKEKKTRAKKKLKAKSEKFSKCSCW